MIIYFELSFCSGIALANPEDAAAFAKALARATSVDHEGYGDCAKIWPTGKRLPPLEFLPDSALVSPPPTRPDPPKTPVSEPPL